MALPADLYLVLAERLLAWADGGLRDLPWRGEPRNPYHVWVSEVMLQQTQVATVVPYFERFVARFPSIASLAAASLDQVLKLWEGLGYYARARHLHAAARRVMADYGGQLPKGVEELRALPGIGAYAAGAIASLAFGQRAPAVDGNARRVLSRLFAIDTDPRQPATQKQLWALAEAILKTLPEARAGLFNEGLMELGATLCTPQVPNCVACPLADFCQARQRGRQTELPVRVPRRRVPHYVVTAAVIREDGDRGRVLIARRALDDMLGGLWEFPGGKCSRGEPLPDCLRREIREELGVEIEVGEQLTVVRHAYTHFSITLHAFACRLLRGRPRAIDCADWRWVALEELERFAFSSADHKIIAALHARPSSAIA